MSSDGSDTVDQEEGHEIEVESAPKHASSIEDVLFDLSRRASPDGSDDHARAWARQRAERFVERAVMDVTQDARNQRGKKAEPEHHS